MSELRIIVEIPEILNVEADFMTPEDVVCPLLHMLHEEDETVLYEELYHSATVNEQLPEELESSYFEAAEKCAEILEQSVTQIFHKENELRRTMCTHSLYQAKRIDDTSIVLTFKDKQENTNDNFSK